jgi:hypothetical protein
MTAELRGKDRLAGSIGQMLSEARQPVSVAAGLVKDQ